MRVLILVLVAMLGAAMGVPKRQQRIVGGEPTTIDIYPYMSNMEYEVWGIFWSQSCGGSLITSTTVLSAAHCYDGDAPSSWRVRLGSDFASSGGSIHYVNSILIHEGYNSNTINNDVAIVRLSTAAVGHGVARIAGPNYILQAGTPVRSIGWGTLSSGGSSPEQLQHVETNVIDQAICAERYAELKTQPGYQSWPDITDGMICAGILDVGGKDACQGDSGGPLAHQLDVLVGVTSWGYGCADATYPGVNARVSHYSDWIVANGST